MNFSQIPSSNCYYLAVWNGSQHLFDKVFFSYANISEVTTTNNPNTPSKLLWSIRLNFVVLRVETVGPHLKNYKTHTKGITTGSFPESRGIFFGSTSIESFGGHRYISRNSGHCYVGIQTATVEPQWLWQLFTGEVPLKSLGWLEDGVTMVTFKRGKLVNF